MLTGILFGVVAMATISLFFLKMWVQLTVVNCTNNVSMRGKTVLITGANAGIGRATALDLARRGAQVILACRNLEKARFIQEYICRVSGNMHVSVKQLDLASLKSVRQCAEEILKEEDRLDVLINNAGILAPPEKTITEDGLELTFSSNLFGHFLLTNLLLDLLKKSGSSRIVCISSAAYTLGCLNLDNDDFHKRRYHWSTHYGHSKLAVMLFVRELSKRLQGTALTVNAVHPGTCGTELFIKPGNLFYNIFQAIGPIWWRTSKQGAQTSIYAATSAELSGVSGKYFVDCAPVQPSKAAQDDDMSDKLWKVSERLTGPH